VKVKSTIKSGLRRINLKISRIPRDRVAGVDLVEDLGLLIPTPHAVCFDVGANEGQTIELLTSALRFPQIYAFEPSTAMFQKLQDKVRRAEVHLHQLALGNEAKIHSFTNYSDPCLSSLLALDRNEANQFRDTTVQSFENVQVETIDNFVLKHSIRQINLLKLDTQGYDLEVLHGAKGAFAAGIVENVLVELNFAPLYKLQASPVEIISYLDFYKLVLVDFYVKHRSGNGLAWCTALFSRRP
jgi:FkbM family methyltransferase